MSRVSRHALICSLARRSQHTSPGSSWNPFLHNTLVLTRLAGCLRHSRLMSTSRVSENASQMGESKIPHSRADKSRINHDAPILKEHLDQLFPPLNFPPELATRILTHSSHPDAAHSHNARLSFIGAQLCGFSVLSFDSCGLVNRPPRSPRLLPSLSAWFLFSQTRARLRTYHGAHLKYICSWRVPRSSLEPGQSAQMDPSNKRVARFCVCRQESQVHTREAGT